jgi:PHS family inorganic phosphate transporter-like MFS transporter
MLASDPNSNGLGWIFITFGIVMGLGALFAWVWIPQVQNTRDDDGRFQLPSKTLEELGEGFRKATSREPGGGGQVIGFRAKVTELAGRLRKRYGI